VRLTMIGERREVGFDRVMQPVVEITGAVAATANS
jgi:hypothetical protein